MLIPRWPSHLPQPINELHVLTGMSNRTLAEIEHCFFWAAKGTTFNI